MVKNRYGFIQLIAVSLGHFMNDFYMNLVPPILFIFADKLSLSLTQQGFISFAILSSSSFAQPFIGYIVDRQGKAWYLIASVVWISLWMSISGVITNYYLLSGVLILGGLASALYHPLGSAIAVSLGNKTKGTSLSIFMGIGGFAASVSPLVALPIASRYGLEKLIYLAIPGLLIALFMFRAGLQEISISGSKSKGSSAGRKIGIYELKWLTLLTTVATVKFAVTKCLITFGIQYLMLKNISLEVSGIAMSIFLFGSSFGTFAGGYFSDIIGDKKVFVLSTIISVISAATLVWIPGIPLLIAFVLIGTVLSATNTPNVVMAQNLMPDKMNLATGMILGFAQGIGGIGVLIYSRIGDLYGLFSANIFLLLLLILSSAITVFVPSILESKKTVSKVQNEIAINK